MKKLLIIEDDKRAALALRLRFEDAGYNVTVAKDALQAPILANQTQPDLITMDVSMPGGDGLKLAEKFRQMDETRHTPIIFVTGRRDEELREKVMALGGAGLCEKPYDPQELLSLAGFALSETSTFHKNRKQAVQRTDSGRQADETKKRKILIVEDDARIAKALEIRMKQSGYEVNCAFDALTSVQTAARILPDLVLLDISMPAGNGFQVAERIQGLMPQPAPIIFLTASKKPQLRAQAEALGAVGYFEKPYEVDRLIEAVGRAIGKSGCAKPSHAYDAV